jgi:hypothetical protein
MTAKAATETVTISKADAEGILSAIHRHEADSDAFYSLDYYTDDEWNGISALIVALRSSRRSTTSPTPTGESR